MARHAGKNTLDLKNRKQRNYRSMTPGKKDSLIAENKKGGVCNDTAL
jgi:hypothetical protein